MSGTKDERSIPIATDARTLEQRQQDTVQNLGRRQKATNPPTTTSARQSRGEPGHRRQWSDELTHWVDLTNRFWPDPMRRMFRDAFTLLPVTQFDLQPLVPFGSVGPFGHVNSILQRMERQLDALTSQMGDTYDILEYPPWDTRQWSEIVPQEVRTGGPLGYLPNIYEVNDKGELSFKTLFNVKGFDPDNVKVNVSKNRVTVSGKKSTKTDTSSSSSEFTRTVYLPDAVDDANMQAHVTGDGFLVLEAPVKCPNYGALGFDSQRQLAVKPQPEGTLALAVTGSHGVQILGDDASGRKIHLETPIEPGFNADDLLVRMEANKVEISGKKHVVEGDGTSQYEHVKEFKQCYAVPGTADALSMQTQLAGNTLVVEAPLLEKK